MPPTEGGGRRHTSTITVAVFRNDEHEKVSVLKSEVEAQPYRSSGKGGQNRNKRYTAVRLTHLPTGTVVCCDEERYYEANLKKAMKRLEERISEEVESQRSAEEASERRDQVGSGMRGDKVRTYNYKENRVTNHITGKSVRRLRDIVERGKLELVQ